MDFNYLYHRHQVSLHMSENAACERSRAAHLDLAIAYWARIEALKTMSRKAAA